jgi:hypothetical protein
MTTAEKPIQFHHDSAGRFVMVDGNGTTHDDVEPVRAFPITAPDHGISVRNRRGEELLWIADLADLTPAARQALDAELARRLFLPVIQRIDRVSSSADPAEWDLVTDRGSITVVIAAQEDVKRLPGDRALVRAADGLRFLIESVSLLDARSRGQIERYL